VLCYAYSDYSDFGFRLKLADVLTHTTTNGHNVPNIWFIRIALSDTEYVMRSREFDTQPRPS